MAWNKQNQQGKPAKAAPEYIVCDRCNKNGAQSWIYADRVALRPFCSVCGALWGQTQDPPTSRQRPRAKPKNKNKNKGQKGEDSGAPEKPPRQPDKAPESKADNALNQVWGNLPPEVQESVRQAGWTPSAPPGLGPAQVGGDSPVDASC